MDNERVEPGKPLAYSEEYLPGAGTFDDGQQIRAALWGVANVDPKTMTLEVQAAGKSAPLVQKGDVVAGLVTYVKPELASVRILEIRGKEGRAVFQPVEGTLHVSKVDNRYIKDLGVEVHCGDIIRAKVIGLRGGPQLAIDRPEFGVIKAFSPVDPGRALVMDGKRLVDPETGHVQHRKVANDYGSGLV